MVVTAPLGVVPGSAGHSLGLRSWPMFHQNPQLTGWLSQPAPGHLAQPIVGMAPTGNAKGYWNVASDGGLKRVPLICRIDTLEELEYFKNGGILQYVLRHLAA